MMVGFLLALETVCLHAAGGAAGADHITVHHLTPKEKERKGAADQ
jgi:hypothetical protein